jgi:hypothetical protein
MTLANAALLSWAALPDKMQDQIPISWLIGLASVLLAFGTAGRLVKQKKVSE